MSAKTDDPHFLQNFELSGFSNWHFGHFIFQCMALDEKDIRIRQN